MWEEPLRERADQAVALVDALPAGRRVLVVADADVDGIAAAGALATAFQRIGRRFVVRLSRRRDPAFFDEVIAQGPDLLVTADLGANQVGRFAAARVPTIILDHHVAKEDGDGRVIVHVNPHLIGEDGSATASGAAVATTFATALLEAHEKPAEDLIAYALLGAEGDRYHAGVGGVGVHGRIEAYLHTLGELSPAALAPGPALPEPRAGAGLTESIDPFIARAAGRPETAANFLRALGVDPDAEVAALDPEARRTLASWLAVELLEQGAAPHAIQDAVGPVWTFTTAAPHQLHRHSVGAVAARLDATARKAEPTMGLAALLGHPVAWEAATARLRSHREIVRAPLGAAARGRLKALGPGHVLHVDDGRYAGSVADRIMAWTRAGAGPVAVLGPMGPRLKVSLRARPSGVLWALDEVAAQAAQACNGIGGGHRLAAGATIPPEEETTFLQGVRDAWSRVARAAGIPTPEAVA